MRRLFYIALGATVGILVVRRVNDAVERWSPNAVANQAGGRLAEWWAIVAEGSAARERELREALGVDDEREHPAA
jgi:microcompartment protein CcmK/EutM